MATISHWIHALNGFVWGFPALVLMICVGLLYTVRTGFVQFRRLPQAISQVGKTLRKSSGSGVSPFQALCTALAATVGTGNIVGVAGAISIGGPGAVFWMWVAGFIGMSLKYGEALLAVRYRTKSPDGTWAGGPMHYIRRGLGSRWSFLATLYCLLGIFAAFGVGNATQVSAVVSGINAILPLVGLEVSATGNWAMGLSIGILVGLVVIGGAKRIGSVAEFLIPAVCLGYVSLSLGALMHHANGIPQAIKSIFTGAFTPSACTGGMVGSVFLTLRTGISRGVFTNEAGMGTAAIAHGGAQVAHPVQQGLFGIFEVFADTLIICTMTALVILTAPISIPYGTTAGVELTMAAFSCTYGLWTNVFLACSMGLLAFATVLGWGLYGMRCAEFLFGTKAGRFFSLAHACMAIPGAVLASPLLWELAETFNGLMAIPNLMALLALSPEVVHLTANYFSKRKILYFRRGNQNANLNQRQSL